MPIYHILGGAKPAKLTGGTLGPTGLSFSIDTTAGWPTGGANGKIPLTLAPGESNEEHVMAQSLSGSTFTIASVADRGVDGTSAGTHEVGTTVIHSFHGTQANDSNKHINDPALDHHTQYMKADGTRHDLTARHSMGTVIPVGTPGAIAVGDSASAGAANSAARSDHRHSVAGGVPVAVGTALSAGVGTSFARNDHVHELGVGSIDTSTFFGAGVVNSTALGAASVIAGKVAAGGISATNQVADAIITMAKLASEASTAFVPSFANVTLGTGGIKWGQYFKFGRLVAGIAGFRLGTSGNVTGPIEFSAPHAIADYVSAAGVTGWITAGRCFDISANVVFSGMGQITDGGSIGDWATAGFSATWDATAPFDWATNDSLQTIFFYEATS